MSPVALSLWLWGMSVGVFVLLFAALIVLSRHQARKPTLRSPPRQAKDQEAPGDQKVPGSEP